VADFDAGQQARECDPSIVEPIRVATDAATSHR
jgi:hypothetical protein